VSETAAVPTRQPLPPELRALLVRSGVALVVSDYRRRHAGDGVAEVGVPAANEPEGQGQ
jgi:hypothetical protein